MVKLFGFDVDGTMTDGGVYYTHDGKKMKKFNVRDGMGIERLRNEGIATVAISSSKCDSIKHRCKDLQIDFVLLGVFNKIDAIKELFKSQDWGWNDFAYIGDDVNDRELLKLARVSSVPVDAILSQKKMVSYICNRRGGEGCLREFAEIIIEYVRNPNSVVLSGDGVMYFH